MMGRVDATPQPGNPWISHLRGHLLLFEPRPRPAYTDSAGFRLLVVAAGLEIVRLSAVQWLYPRVPLWVLLPLLLGIALVSVPAITGVRLSQLGLRRWGEWTTTEKSYFLQVMILAIAFLAELDGSWSRFKECGDPTCRSVFYDRSKNRSGKWCVMAECGNRAKVRAYRERERAKA